MEAVSTRSGLWYVDGVMGGKLPFPQLCYMFYVQKGICVSSNLIQVLNAF